MLFELSVCQQNRAAMGIEAGFCPGLRTGARTILLVQDARAIYFFRLFILPFQRWLLRDKCTGGTKNFHWVLDIFFLDRDMGQLCLLE
jgi:hypothetical protein